MNEFSNLGEQIKNTVQDAVDTMNFDHLNKNITDSVNSALSEVRNRLNINSFSNGKPNQNVKDWKVTYGSSKGNAQAGNQDNTYQQSTQAYSQYNQSGQTRNQYSGQSNAQSQAEMWEKRKQAAIDRANQMRRNYNNAQKSYARQQYNVARKAQNTQMAVYAKRVPGRFSGPMLKGLGTVCTIGSGAVSAFSLVECLRSGFYYDNMLNLLFFGGAFLVSLAITGTGRRLSNRAKRFRQYVAYIGERKFCQIESLAANTGFSKKFIVKDLRKMMRLGLFPQAHLDNKGTCLILDHETYQQYLSTTSEYERKKEQEESVAKQEKKSETKSKDETPEDAELRKTISEGREYIRQIKEANEAIPAIDISEKLSRLEQITSKIFSFVEQHPEQRSELRKFMEYYLPITLKLVNAYKELDAQLVQGDNITKSKKEIVQTLDTINYAFENLLDSLYQSTAMEVSSDISVLEALFAQDGLTKKDFDLK